ncbi:MAG: hypothetical protein ACR2MS_01635 [Weeksellaceae bacterium]
MKKVFLLFIISISFYTHAQITFQSGYIVNNQGQKSEVWIKNIDWINNPTSITYKTNPEAPIQIAEIIDYSKNLSWNQIKIMLLELAINSKINIA